MAPRLQTRSASWAFSTAGMLWPWHPTASVASPVSSRSGTAAEQRRESKAEENTTLKQLSRTRDSAASGGPSSRWVPSC
jgi:hypothetical protein